MVAERADLPSAAAWRTLWRMPSAEFRRILVAVPNWVGDVVLASPVLGALREHFHGAAITLLLRSYVRELVAGGGWHDREICWPDERGLRGLAGLVGEIRRERFDAALLLTNSFRSALVVWLARVPRRVGYARDGRTLMLTDRLSPARRDGRFVPSSVLPYYAKIAQHVGCDVRDWRLRLGITAEQELAGRELKRHYSLHDSRYAVVNPGAAFGASKCWLPERFAEACDQLRDEHRLTPVLVGAPGEHPLLREIASRARGSVVVCDNPGTTLGSLKPLIRDAALLLCNDTGPRHYGNAFCVPTVTLFGPTHQAWTETDYAGETRLQVKVECGPCQLPKCPLDHRCMTLLTVDAVMSAVRKRIAERGTPPGVVELAR